MKKPTTKAVEKALAEHVIAFEEHAAADAAYDRALAVRSDAYNKLMAANAAYLKARARHEQWPTEN